MMFLRRIYGNPVELGLPEGWKLALLDSVAVRGSGHTPDKKKPEYWNGGVKWVSLADSHRLDNRFIWETDKEISDLGIKNSSAVLHSPGTVILSRDAGVGKSAMLGKEMAVSQHFIAWKCGSNLSNEYLYYLLQYMKPEFERMAVGSTIKTIGLGYFKKLHIAIPPLPEQRKIAAILGTWDEAIAQVEQLIAALKQRKKGLMQRLLTGKVRFPGFEGEWEERGIGELVKFEGGSQPPKSTFIRNPDEGYIRLIQVRDYKTSKYATYVSEEAVTKFCSKEDIMIGRYGPPLFQIFRGLEGAYNVALMKAIPKENVLSDYLYYFLKQEDIANYLESLSQRSGGQTGVEMDRLRKYPFPIPSMSEQSKIRDVLLECDREIGLVKKKLRIYRRQKNGLMQRLLTGQIRVNVDEQAHV